MKSRNKIDVYARRMPRYGNKRWVIVEFKARDWVPSFKDIFRLIRAICFCEDEKYPHGLGRKMVSAFLVDCCNPEMTWEELREKYKIPDRNSESEVRQMKQPPVEAVF